MKPFSELNPTPEMQAAYDEGYKAGVNCAGLGLSGRGETKEEVLLRLSILIGYTVGLQEYAAKRGIKSDFFSELPDPIDPTLF